MHETKVKKIAKPFTPFAFRRTAIDAFDALFKRFADSIQILSYSSNAYPDLQDLVGLMKRYKKRVDVFQKEHRYHFGSHEKAKRNLVQEYLLVGTG